MAIRAKLPTRRSTRPTKGHWNPASSPTSSCWRRTFSVSQPRPVRQLPCTRRSWTGRSFTARTKATKTRSHEACFSKKGFVTFVPSWQSSDVCRGLSISRRLQKELKPRRHESAKSRFPKEVFVTFVPSWQGSDVCRGLSTNRRLQKELKPRRYKSTKSGFPKKFS